MNCEAVSRGGRFWLGHQHCKAWPWATACGGKGLTMLVAQRVATMRSTVEFGLGKSCAKIIHVGIYLRILTGIHSFSRWAKSGVWQRVFAHLAEDADTEYAMIDSTIVRAHQHSAGAPKKAGEDQAIGGSRGGLSTRIHTLVDALGNPIGFHLTGGEAHDLVGANHLLPERPAEALIADKAFNAEKRVIEPLIAAGKTVVIPSKPNRRSPRTYDRDLCKARHLVENFFARLKQFPAIATRHDKTARNFLAAVHLAASIVRLN